MSAAEQIPSLRKRAEAIVSDRGIVVDLAYRESGDVLPIFLPACPACGCFGLHQRLASKLLECLFCERAFEAKLERIEG